jgi:hypothetical protein
MGEFDMNHQHIHTLVQRIMRALDIIAQRRSTTPISDPDYPTSSHMS